MDRLLNQINGFSFGSAGYDKGGLYGPIIRPYLVVFRVDEGSVEVHFDGESSHVEAGQVGLFASRTRAEFAYRKGIRSIGSWCESYLPKLKDDAFDQLNKGLGIIKATDRVSSLLKIGIETGMQSSPHLNEMRNAIGKALVRAYYYEIMKHEEVGNYPGFILRARRTIEDNYIRDDIRVAEVANLSAVTPQHLITSFKKHFGITPTKYIWELRAKQARQLLIQTGHSQAEIAYRCGYKSASHFSRHMKKQFGMTPNQLRTNRGYTESSALDDEVEDITY